jgi:hypothetical protein
MNKIKKDSIYTFIANQSKIDPEFIGNEIVLSIPGNKILEASQFAQREKLQSIYLVYKNNSWHLQTCPDNNCFSLEVTPEGLSERILDAYIIHQETLFA